MAIPFSYSLRNLRVRRLTTILTAAGMALVVFVFAATMMLAEGFRATLVATGSADNIVVLRKSSNAEVQSGIERDKAALVETSPDIAMGGDGERLLAKELVVLINLRKRDSVKPANVTIRGVSQASFLLRPQARLAEGRLPRAGAAEILVGKSIARRFTGTGLGESLRFGQRDWRVVGVLDAGNTGFSSEIWGDIDQLMAAFRRPVYSSVLFRMRDQARFSEIKAWLETDPRLQLDAKRETVYYEDQSKSMALFLRIMGLALTSVFSLGAIIGAMITMYAAVAHRVVEIGTLRALGFGRASILISFMAEALLLGGLGGAMGVAGASFMQLITISTMNWESFSELSFSFRLTGDIVAKSMIFALVMGFLGGALPAFRASRLRIVEALRS